MNTQTHVRIIVNISFDRVRRGPVVRIADVPKVWEMLRTHYDDGIHWRTQEETPDRLDLITKHRNTPRRIQVWTTWVGLDKDAELTVEDIMNWDHGNEIRQ